MTEHHERRRFSRVLFNIPATLSQGGAPWQAELMDISLKGLLLADSLPVACNLHQPFTVTIPLSDQAFIRMTMQLAHQEEHQTGLECISIDMDSIAHLRRLIELNLGDPKAAERELAELIIGSLRERPL